MVKFSAQPPEKKEVGVFGVTGSLFLLFSVPSLLADMKQQLSAVS